MSLLLAAAAVAVYTTGGPAGPRAPGTSQNSGGGPSYSSRSGDPHLTRYAPKSPRTRSPFADVMESMHIEPLGPAHPALEAQAQRVETGARNRLVELHEELDLSDDQKRAIFPLLARSHPDYSESLHIVGVPLSRSISALGKLAADHQIHKVLDPWQQEELEVMAASADVWWTDVIARLERDLVESTREPVAAGHAPLHDPSPPNEEPPTSPAPVPTQRTGSGNLLDRLRPNGS